MSQEVDKKSWGYGYGNITLEPSGRYRARWWNKTRKRYDPLGTYDTREEAEQELAAHHAAMARGVVCDGIGFVEYGLLCIKRWKNGGKDSWRSDDSRLKIIEKHASFATLSPSTLQTKRGVLKDFLNSVFQIESERGEPYSASSVKHVRNLMNGIFKEAVDDELCTQNPMLMVPAPKGFTHDNWTALTLPEMTQLARCHRDTRFADDDVVVAWPADQDRLGYEQCVVFLFVIFTGLRQGECAALLWIDVIDLDGNSPHLWVSKSWHKPYTKTRKARRVDLIPAAVALLKKWRAHCTGPRGGLSPHVWGKQYAYGHDWGWAPKVELFEGKTQGIPVCRLGARQLAGIARHVTFHHLRDTCASHLLTGTWGFKWTIAEVAALLGHTTTYVTERYARILPGALAEIAARTFRPVSVPELPPPSQVVEITGRAMQDSNLRHLAPEANTALMIPGTCEADGNATETATAPAQALAAELMRQAMELAMKQLQAAAQPPVLAEVIPLKRGSR